MKNIVVYPHQLFENNKLITENSTVYIIEHPYFFTKYDFNKNCMVYHKATTKFYYDYVKKNLSPKNVIYINFNDYNAMKKKLYSLDIHIYDPIERDLQSELEKYSSVKTYESPMFITSYENLVSYKEKTKSYLMNNFYVWQRKRLNLFIDENKKPYYGKWSFDKDNRKKFPKTYSSSINKFKNKYVITACKDLNINIKDLHCWLPITFDEVKYFFEDFIKRKLSKFGDYEDAISSNVIIGNHSAISSVLNIGMITPATIIKKIKQLEKNKNFKQIYNSIEGFTRQIIGWREYMRYVYVFEYENLVANKLKHTNKIKDFNNIISDIPIIDDVLQKIYKNGWTHHIERLMVLGNYFMLCEVDPHDVYKFFYQHVCLDAYDWVMVGNVYGMSQFASKIQICSKMYLCSSNYLLKMSDYKKGEWCYLLDCLFYRFIGRHYQLLKSNYSTAIFATLYDKNKNKNKMIKFANNYIKQKFI